MHEREGPIAEGEEEHRDVLACTRVAQSSGVLSGVAWNDRKRPRWCEGRLDLDNDGPLPAAQTDVLT